MALWVSALIRATQVLFNHLVVQPEPTIKILCFMIILLEWLSIFIQYMYYGVISA